MIIIIVYIVFRLYIQCTAELNTYTPWTSLYKTKLALAILCYTHLCNLLPNIILTNIFYNY